MHLSVGEGQRPSPTVAYVYRTSNDYLPFQDIFHIIEAGGLAHHEPGGIHRAVISFFTFVKKKLDRVEGAIFILLGIAYMAFLIYSL